MSLSVIILFILAAIILLALFGVLDIKRLINILIVLGIFVGLLWGFAYLPQPTLTNFCNIASYFNVQSQSQCMNTLNNIQQELLSIPQNENLFRS